MPENAIRKKSKLTVGQFFANYTAIIAVILALVFFTFMKPGQFLTGENVVSILRSISITTVLAMALTFTLGVGGFDLSAGYAATWAAYCFMSMTLWFGLSMFMSMVIAFATTVVVGLFAMLLIIVFKIPDLLATLAIQFVLDGLILTYSGGGAISSGMPLPNGKPSVGYVTDAVKSIGQVPLIIILMAVCVLFVHIFLKYTKFGRYIYATGGNKTAARFSGIPVKRYRIIAAMFAAFFIFLGGCMVSSRSQSAQIGAATGFSLPALSAVFIGRSVLGQGKPNAFGTLVGATLVGILDNGLIMINVPYYSLNMVKGIVLLVALASSYYNTKED